MLDIKGADKIILSMCRCSIVLLAVQVTYQPQTQAFTAEQLDGIAKKLIAVALKATGATLLASPHTSG
jgi:hypothetical protein